MSETTPKSWLARLNQVIAAVALTAFIGMLITTWSQILFRKLALSVDWTEELARVLFMVSVFLSIAIGIYERKHIVVDFIHNKLPRRLAICSRLFFNGLILIFLIFLLRGAAAMTVVTWDSYMIAMSWMRTGHLYLAECVAIAVMMVFVLAAIGGGFRDLIAAKPTDDGAAPS